MRALRTAPTAHVMGAADCSSRLRRSASSLLLSGPAAWWVRRSRAAVHCMASLNTAQCAHTDAMQGLSPPGPSSSSLAAAPQRGSGWRPQRCRSGGDGGQQVPAAACCLPVVECTPVRAIRRLAARIDALQAREQLVVARTPLQGCKTSHTTQFAHCVCRLVAGDEGSEWRKPSRKSSLLRAAEPQMGAAAACATSHACLAIATCVCTALHVSSELEQRDGCAAGGGAACSGAGPQQASMGVPGRILQRRGMAPGLRCSPQGTAAAAACCLLLPPHPPLVLAHTRAAGGSDSSWLKSCCC